MKIPDKPILAGMAVRTRPRSEGHHALGAGRVGYRVHFNKTFK